MAATPVTPTPVGAWPTAPQRTDAPATFVTRADAWVSATPTRTTEMNALATNVNTNATSAFDSAAEAVVSASAASVSAAGSATSAATAAGIAGYGGAWSSLTGAAAVPLSVAHEGAFWILLTSIADITASEPGVSVDWARAYGSGSVESRTSNVAFTAQDSGKIISYTSGTFSQTFGLAADLGPNWYIYAKNAGSGAITFDPSGAETIDGEATKILKKDTITLILCDGTLFTTIETLTALADSRVEVTTGNGHGATNTKIRRYSTIKTNTGTAITYADSATLGATFTINEGGLYSIYAMDTTSSGDSFNGASVNSSELTTNIQTITDANRISIVIHVSAYYMPATKTVRLAAGDIVRSHTSGTPDSTAAVSSVFSITKVGV